MPPTSSLRFCGAVPPQVRVCKDSLQGSHRRMKFYPLSSQQPAEHATKPNLFSVVAGFSDTRFYFVTLALQRLRPYGILRRIICRYVVDSAAAPVPQTTAPETSASSRDHRNHRQLGMPSAGPDSSIATLRSARAQT